MHKSLLIGILTLASYTFGFAQNSKWAAWETEADTLMGREDFKKAIALYTKIIKASGLKQKLKLRVLSKKITTALFTKERLHFTVRANGNPLLPI